MSELTEHYRRLLGLDDAWRVASVDFRPQDKRVAITVEHVGAKLTCPECQATCGQADQAEPRSWRHLDTMQFETRITAAVPRCRCPACGVKTVAVPWAGKHARFTLLFEAFAVDMWPAYATATEKHAPQAEIVHDTFHVAKHLNEAVNAVRRREHRELQDVGDERLTGSKQLWLFNRTNLKGARRRELDALKEEDLKTSRAWAVKENFRRFWQHVYASSAHEFFDGWYGWAVRTRLKPIVEKAKMLKRHLPRLLSYFRHTITNAAGEGFNSRIQATKAAARGFTNFDHYRTRILFFCGKLQLLPETSRGIP